jgi:hypothetical protein
MAARGKCTRDASAGETSFGRPTGSGLRLMRSLRGRLFQAIHRLALRRQLALEDGRFPQ